MSRVESPGPVENIYGRGKIKAKSASGFTLMELLVTMALLSLLLLVAVPVLKNFGNERSLEITARNLAIDMRRTRQMAITSGDPHCLEFFLSQHSYHYKIKNCMTADSEECYFSTGVSYSSTTFPLVGSVPQLRFNPMGAPNSGGTVVLKDARGEKIYVIVTPATARVRVSKEPPGHWEMLTK